MDDNTTADYSYTIASIEDSTYLYGDLNNPDTFVITDFVIHDNLVEEDLVNNPKHYTSHPSGIECIDVVQHYNFCVGNAIKYLWRNGLKKDMNMPSKVKQIQDLEKAIWYINREIFNISTNAYE